MIHQAIDFLHSLTNPDNLIELLVSTNKMSSTTITNSIIGDKNTVNVGIGRVMNDRMTAVRTVIGTLSQSMRFGTPLAQSMRTAANDMRNLQLIELEEKAARLPALLTIPVLLFIMPSLFLIVGGPAALKLIDLFNQH